MRPKRIVLLTLSFFAVIGLSFGINIGLLEITGNITISTEEILQVITKCHQGNEVTYADIERDIFNVKDMGFFQDVKYTLSKYSEDSQILSIQVIEYPIVSDVQLKISGPGLVSKKTLEEYISIETGKALNYKKLIRTQNSLKNQYIMAGYQLLEIKNNVQEYESEIFLPNGVLKIEIWEYALYDIILKGDFGDIQYEEVKELLDLRLLKDYYNDFFRLFLIKKNYYPSNSELQMAFSRLYNTGLIGPETNVDFENHPQPLETGEHVTNLVVTIQLNPVVPDKQPFRTLTIEGNTLVPSFELTDNLKSVNDSEINLMNVLRDVQRIKAVYEENGYPLVVITPKYYKSEERLTFKVTEGILKDYRIEGLTKTRKDLVEREISFNKNKPVTMRELRQTYINLNKTGYFSSINIEPLGISANSTAVTIIVKLQEMENNVEFKTNVTFDPKYGGETVIQNIYGKIGLALKNPMGQGQTIDVSTTLGKYPNISLGYNVRSVFSSPIDAGISLSYGKNFNQRTLEINDPSTETNIATVVTFESEDFTIKPNISYRIDDFQNVGMDITWGRFKNFGFSTDDASFTNQIAKEGVKLILGADYQYDRRDDLFSPNEGFVFNTRAEWSLPFEFVTDHWIRLNESISGFYSPWENHIFAGRFISAQIPWEDEDDPINYSVGGSNNIFIRGIDYQRGIRANYISAINLEYRYRFVNTNNIAIEFSLFNDNAMGWNKFSEISNSKLYSSLGFGFRFNIPGFGVLRLDVPWDFSPYLISSEGPKWGGITFGYGQMF